MNIFNNDNPHTNGEVELISSLPKNLTIFDVGSRSDSEFLNYEGVVHYFEPVSEFLERLKTFSNKNTESYFNNFGLSNLSESLFYYPRHQSFVNRSRDSKNDKVLLQLMKGDEYILKNNISKIDFLKIDTEGFEFNVLKGFETSIDLIDTIQFEYGGCFSDNNITLNEVCSFLKTKGFNLFYYVAPTNPVLLSNFSDHYQYSNILCKRK